MKLRQRCRYFTRRLGEEGAPTRVRGLLDACTHRVPSASLEFKAQTLADCDVSVG